MSYRLEINVKLSMDITNTITWKFHRPNRWIESSMESFHWMRTERKRRRQWENQRIRWRYFWNRWCWWRRVFNRFTSRLKCFVDIFYVKKIEALSENNEKNGIDHLPSSFECFSDGDSSSFCSFSWSIFSTIVLVLSVADSSSATWEGHASSLFSIAGFGDAASVSLS